MAHFFAMGGYAAFVWPAYGVSFLALLATVWRCWAEWRKAQKRLSVLEEDSA